MMGFSTVVIIVFIISLSFLLTQKGKDIVNTEVNNYLHEISQQTSYKVTQRVETNFSYLATLSNAFEWIGTVDHKGMLKVKNHPLKDVSQLTCVAKAMHGQVSVSDKLLKIFDEKGAVYAVPYKGKDNNISAIVG